jgi:hypothetical protein
VERHCAKLGKGSGLKLNIHSNKPNHPLSPNSYLKTTGEMQYRKKNSYKIYYQLADPSNWLLFSGVMPLPLSSCPKGDSGLILPDMKG